MGLLPPVISVLPQRLARLQRASSFRMQGLRLVLDGIADPGNRAAVIRTAEGFGLLNLHVVNPSVNFDRRTAKNRSITTGGQKWINIETHETVPDCVNYLRSRGFKIFTAKPENPGRDSVSCPIPLQDLDFSKNVALVFGNEHQGISQEMSKLADGDFTIPMFGLTESLNISVAAAICIHWGRQAREKALGAKTDLTEEEQSVLLDQYQMKSTHFQKHVKLDPAADGKPSKEERRRMWEASAPP